ncbi:hypothetical protein GLA29479_1927 [Lysobacter antibioticus]|uniref:catalase family protein n=1 Tax=Lysobacter antibioticus TaxID=84531 RepID=UPI0007170152|nr:catalase family protein [Lysobacter antibioticus]ALN62800.1 hypothetical protein GLA29479_1927 [Lysobacter antibioticus]
MSTTRHPSDLPYPSVDEMLGEALYPHESDLALQIADAIEKSIREQYRPGQARRDAHPKATGFVEAEFRVNDSLAPSLAQGVFVPGKVYQAWIRFSNGAGDPTRSDDNDDGRGMAIKLLGVPGPKLLENDREATTQDFVMINHPVFLANDPHRYLSLVEKASSGRLLDKVTIPFALGLKGTLRAKEISSGKISNPLQVRYFSAVPYQLGVGAERQAIKFSVMPATAEVDPMPAQRGPDYLREAMKRTLAERDVVLKFLVQPRTSDSMSVEDSMTAWDEAQAPFFEVASIHIPRQEFDTPERNRLGEDIAYSPWHSLPEHRPLGSTNRLRKLIYDRISRVRHEMNSVEQPGR